MSLRQMTTGAISGVLCLGPASPALGQEYRPIGFEAPRGAAAALELRVPLGPRSPERSPTIGLSLGYGRETGPGDFDVRSSVRRMRIADFRFGPSGTTRARLAGVDLAGAPPRRRMNLDGFDKKNIWIPALAVVGGIIAYILIDDGDSEGSESPGTSSPPDG